MVLSDSDWLKWYSTLVKIQRGRGRRGRTMSVWRRPGTQRSWVRGERFRSDSKAIQGRFGSGEAIRQGWRLGFGAIQARPLSPCIILMRLTICSWGCLATTGAMERGSLELYHAPVLLLALLLGVLDVAEYRHGKILDARLRLQRSVHTGTGAVRFQRSVHTGTWKRINIIQGDSGRVRIAPKSKRQPCRIASATPNRL